MSKEKRPSILVRKTARGLSPVTAYDAELLYAAGMGEEFELSPMTKRSNRQLRTYWLALKRVCDTTGRWPTPEHLHDELKLVCGFKRNVVDMQTGEVAVVVDSIAFNAMTQDEFRVYMDLAMEKLSDAIGFDPLAFLEAA
ncbi:hypothetical protein NO932_06405 [Pelagibacterium sp. 26DY04]|uniref:hypothetical protein n=1 Tax=Pelagibacterium sp. 26DY04 TaxID=2967130 RepID=UPI00281510C9|nr:hypothetical protein [Pelagibacterium sp. 26DY04]WMT88236.1 hypothetical protein NO932_06405 [Pelagibacterium sp. 26DY04]